MVVLLNLDEDGNPADHAPPNGELGVHDLRIAATPFLPAKNSDHAFVRATACYPIVTEVARFLDLTSLDHLSRACQSIRINLLQHRPSLISRTLRCRNDLATERRSLCARDLVSPCQKCDGVVCRNCISKPLSNYLASRHRRLCRTCAKSPLEKHLTFVDRNEDDSSAAGEETPIRIMWQGQCTCVEQTWFCEPCGRRQLSDDSMYRRGWTWRHRFSRQGPGIGEGEQGVLCGREGRCLAVREVEVEIDAGQFDSPSEMPGQDGRKWSPTSYFTQEIEGIGGVVKKKVKKRVPVGHVVKEYEDERETGDYLRREQTGSLRSWCAHCSKVIPSKKDADVESHEDLDRVVSSSGSSAWSS